MEVDKDLVIAALEESIDILQTENANLRNSNRILRMVFRTLREANESMRRSLEMAKANDEMFKSWCAGNFDAPVVDGQAGLADAQQTVEPTV